MRASLRQWPAIAAVVVAAALPTVARADAATDLVGLINDYRRAPPACAGKRLPRWVTCNRIRHDGNR